MVRVIELSGQSNAAGRVDYTSLPSEYSGVIRGIKVWDGTDFVHMEIDSATAWNLDIGTGVGKFGIQPFLSKLGNATLSDEVYLFMAGVGSTGLDVSFGDWWVGESVYNSYKSDLGLMRDWFAARNMEFKVTHKIWMQGEADATTLSTANDYGTNFATFKTVNDALLYGICGDYPDWLVCPLLSTSSPTYASTVRTAQLAASGVTNIDTSGLSFLDGVHYDLSSVETIADRFMTEIIADWGVNRYI